MEIAVTGATGFIGRRLCEDLLKSGHTLRILGRSQPPGIPGRFFPWNATGSPPPQESLDGTHAVIHLAGAPVAQRWTPEVKRQIRDSRVEGTRLLVQALTTCQRRPSVLVSGSAVGFYGDRGDTLLPESARAGKGFLSEVCVEWERQAELAESLGIRVVRLRTGVVLGRGGGALEKMLTPFKLGLGGPIAGGRQWMPWIHLEDIVGMIVFAIGNDRLTGPVNGVGPEPVRNSEFTRALGKALQRPTIFPVPQFGLRMLFGEMAEVLLASQRALPHAAERAGYTFRYPDLLPALRDCVA